MLRTNSDDTYSNTEGRERKKKRNKPKKPTELGFTQEFQLYEKMISELLYYVT